MSERMAIHLSDGPADRLVRIHTEHSEWDEPDIRYLRRRGGLNERVRALRLCGVDGTEEIVLAFGGIRVRIHADDDHIRISLCDASPPPAA